MSLFSRRWWRDTDEVDRPVLPLRVLKADGQRVDLTARDAGARLAATRMGQDWQTDAWNYRDLIGELRYSNKLLARSVASVRFYAAEMRPYPDDPAELAGSGHGLDKQLAEEAVTHLARLPLDDDPDGFTASLVENLAAPGEGFIHGQRDGQEEFWTVRSISEITANGDQIMLAELPGSSALGQRAIDPDGEELLRCWMRHPRWGQLADSPLRAMLDTCEEIVLAGREIRAAARSRLAANGFLLLPESLSLVRTRSDEEDLESQSVTDEEFMADLTTAMISPIRTEGDAGAIVPLVLRGSAEDLKEVRHVKLERADAVALMERLNGAVYRMLRGLDIQPEQVQGLGDTNHWGAWSIEAANVKHQVGPMAAAVAACLTKAFMRPALRTLDHDPEQLRRVGVWYDLSGLVENPNRGQDARDAHDRIVISDARFRLDLGYDDDDAPDDEERNRRIAAKAGIDQGTAAAVLELAAYAREARRGAPQVIDARAAPELPSGTGNGAHPAVPGQTVPEQPTPRAPTAVVSAATPDLPVGWRVDIDTARALAAVDTALIERIITAADAAIARAVERAGGRARNAVRKDQGMSASIEGVDTVLVASALGRDVLLAAVGLPELLADAFTRLKDQVLGWLEQAARAVADLVLRMLGLDRASTAGRRVHDVVTTRMEVHRPAAWDVLAEALDAAVEKALFRADPLTPEPAGRGEQIDTLITPAAVVRAVTIAGGGQPSTAGDGGVGTGPVVRGVLGEADGVVLGWEWQYHPERPRGSHFPQHVALDGVRFGTWTDPKLDTALEHRKWIGLYYRPGDHDGCRCGSAPVIAFPELDDDSGGDIVLQRLREASQSERGQLAARVAAEDTAAGRIGTSLQNEVEVRNRITADVERLRAHHIG